MLFANKGQSVCASQNSCTEIPHLSVLVSGPKLWEVMRVVPSVNGNGAPESSPVLFLPCEGNQEGSQPHILS